MFVIMITLYVVYICTYICVVYTNNLILGLGLSDNKFLKYDTMFSKGNTRVSKQCL